MPNSKLFKFMTGVTGAIVAFVIIFTLYGVFTQCEEVAIYQKDNGALSCQVH